MSSQRGGMRWVFTRFYFCSVAFCLFWIIGFLEVFFKDKCKMPLNEEKILKTKLTVLSMSVKKWKSEGLFTSNQLITTLSNWFLAHRSLPADYKKIKINSHHFRTSCFPMTVVCPQRLFFKNPEYYIPNSTYPRYERILPSSFQTNVNSRVDSSCSQLII